VGYEEKITDFRDCFDFKFRKSTLTKDTRKESLELQKIWQEIYDRLSIAVNEYCTMYSVGELKYWEAFNFLKYEKGQHFQYHHDHASNYNCTISLVQYLNDDYEGGELSFGGWNYTYKPVAGDLVIFPSNYMYTHRAMPVTSGTKYALATMLDYSDKYHSAEMHQKK
jgi:predicted 2-oxoglutarate/Fe(II)-dependent dioxygenase YbiX